ncbi:hypothetical protein OG618_37575 (plasmid) [Kitasatospora sp. NBC_01246]|uniref:hypothetical protein n=1 Tax=Kitasatospora sp. NBC_01246 TaxID=2903570 RepID=UPI002E374CF7|nr:hypothetical protein [Kitasatospora sp. NBC_01246]
MANRLTEYREDQAAGRLRVPITTYRWAVHTGIAPKPGPGGTWSGEQVEAMDREAIRAAVPAGGCLSGGQAADRIAEAIGRPNEAHTRASVAVFVVQQLVGRGLLTDLSGNPDGSLLHPDQVAEVCGRADLARLVAEESPLGPEQAATRLGIRRVDFDHVTRLGWLTPATYWEVRFGTSRAGAVYVPVYRTVEVDGLCAAHPEVNWEVVRSSGRGKRSPLAALKPAGEAVA